MVKKLRKQIVDFTKLSLTTTVGADVVSRVGVHSGSAAGQTAGALGAGALATGARFYPAMGTMIVGSGALRMLGKLGKVKKKRRRR